MVDGFLSNEALPPLPGADKMTSLLIFCAELWF